MTKRSQFEDAEHESAKMIVRAVNTLRDNVVRGYLSRRRRGLGEFESNVPKRSYSRTSGMVAGCWGCRVEFDSTAKDEKQARM